VLERGGRSWARRLAPTTGAIASPGWTSRSTGGTVAEASDKGDTVVVTACFKRKNKSGAELDTQAEHAWQVRDGKLARFENKVDEAAWARAGAERPVAGRSTGSPLAL
jgi:hypothetical protein